MTADIAPAEIPITTRVQTVLRRGFAVDFGKDAAARYTFAALLREDHPHVWCFGDYACHSLANMVLDKGFMYRLDEAEERLADIMQVAFGGTVVSESENAALRAKHYPHPLRDAVRKAMIAAWEDGADVESHHELTGAERATCQNTCINQLLAEIPW